MVYAPQTQSGTFFNTQERDVRSLQVVGVLTIAQDRWRHGQHVFKLGVDMQRSSFDGQSVSRGLDVVRVDESLAERTTYQQVVPEQDVAGTELAGFIQDRWRVNNRMSLELGLRADREAITERINVSPRVGMSVSVLPRRASHPARRHRQVRRTHAADRRRVHPIRNRDGTALRAWRRTARKPRHVRTHDRRQAGESGEHSANGGMGSAVRTPGVLQSRLRPSHRVARLHRESRRRPRSAGALLLGQVHVLGDRNDGTISRQRAPRRHRSASAPTIVPAPPR